MRKRFCMSTTGRATIRAARVKVSANAISEARQVTTASVVTASRFRISARIRAVGLVSRTAKTICQ